VDEERLTPRFVRQYLALLADIHISEAEAAELIPAVEANRRGLALLDRFDVGEVRSALAFNPELPDEG
jgi:hypothetical protein